MTAPSSLAFPGSRTLAGWWQQLAPLRPQALWVGHVFLHRVEALVVSVTSQPLRTLDRFVLRALAAEQSAGEELLPRLNARLHLGAGLLRQVLRALAAQDLVESGMEDTWGLTAQGRAAMESGFFPQMRLERRVFHFVETFCSPPHFLGMNGSVCLPCAVAEDWSFDVALLEACVHQSPAWKKQFGFPEDVREILSTGPSSATAPAWQRVIVDQAERLPVLLALMGAAIEKSHLQAFAVRQEGWHVQPNHPLFTLAGDWHLPFPELTDKPSETACRMAWQAWCQPRGLPAEEAEACAVLADGLHLRVKTPAALIERLRASRSDALKGEAWILVGDGAVRAALLLDIREY